MKKPFTISWGKPKVVLSLPKYQEIASGDTLQRLTSYSESVLNTLRKNHLPSADYGQAEIEILSDGINATRLQYNADSREKIANLYACFLGTSIIRSYAALQGRWVQCEEGLGILLSSAPGERLHLAFPIARVFKQIDHGEDYSIYSRHKRILPC
jgi:hypothetical protein